MWGRAGAVASVLAMAVAGLAHPASADSGGELRKLYREDASAGFVIHTNPNCAAERIEIGVSFHQDFYHVLPAPAPRNVSFGLSIAAWDCAEQFLWSAEGFDAAKLPFDVTPGLTGAKASDTISACLTFPAPGDCFDVEEHVAFKGVGTIAVSKQHNVVDDPDCKIDQRLVTMTRAAKVWATISFTPPGGSPVTYSLTTADLTPAGASLFTDSENTYMRGDGYNCTNH